MSGPALFRHKWQLDVNTENAVILSGSYTLLSRLDRLPVLSRFLENVSGFKTVSPTEASVSNTPRTAQIFLPPLLPLLGAGLARFSRRATS